jgi:hypothetical protein
MATYNEIAKHVRTYGGFSPKTCWIAYVLSDHGLIKRTASNRINPGAREKPCPPSKRDAIEAALKYFSMI